MVAAVDANAEELTNITITASDDTGTQLTSYLHGCPANLPSRYLCTYGLHGSAGNPELTLSFSTESTTVSKRVELRPRNYCGREIGYVRVTFSAEGQLMVDDIVYVSPCVDFDEP